MQEYREIIENLVKNHQKYSGCESILNEIIDEVLKQAEPVIGEVTYSAIVEGYLNKIIDRTMVTIPKKFNINTRTSKPKIVLAPDISDQQIEEELVISEETADTDILPASEEEYAEELITPSATEELAEEFIPEATEELNEEVLEEPIIENQDFNTTESTAELEVSDFENTQDNQFELDADNIALETFETDDLENSEIYQPVTEEADINTLDENEIEVENELQTEQEVNIDLVDKMINGISPDKELEEDIFADSDNEYDNLNELTTVDSTAEELEIDEELPQENDSTEELRFEENEYPTNAHPAEFKVPDFSVFAFTPETKADPVDDITAKLEDAHMPDNSEIDILRIASMKFKENKSVQEIADLLNISREDVISALDYASDMIEGD